MALSTSVTARQRRHALTCAAIAVVMAGAILWGAMQAEDPLSRYIHTDKMRHILAFGAIGLCAGFMPSSRWRMIGLCAVIAFAFAVEAIQVPIVGRNASISDLFASGIGAFAGFGFGAAALITWDIIRQRISPDRISVPPQI
jgi:VanZ family protein